MKRLSLASLLLVVGGVLILVGLPLQWTSVSFPDHTITAMRGIDYASYDVVTTVVLAVALIAVAVAVAAARRWVPMIGVIVAVLACLWGALVVVAAANPAADGSALAGVNVSIGLGAYAVAAGAALALIGSVMSFRGRTIPVTTSRVASSV
jgi:hypothetical protein